MKVTVHSTPNCVQCNMTKREMTKLGIEFEEVDLSQHPELLAEFKEKGYLASPIVVAGEQVWSGFKHERIKGLAHIRNK